VSSQALPCTGGYVDEESVWLYSATPLASGLASNRTHFRAKTKIGSNRADFRLHHISISENVDLACSRPSPASLSVN
jgi:hypothetical protein